ncbi:MAG TPA: NAD(P)/FAD-dependent oxidoreductase [Mycobacteriales bacterium]|jgi:protoporphyrinogen oxidase|nr:NAD(P)/FAD-dependent oxidoreductase [Mycobacteriales bacterium]
MTDAHRGSVDHVVIAGAGPAGLTAALELVRRDHPTIVLEATDAIGGISQTVERDGWRFDIGGHRFFTKVQRVEEWWHQILGDDEFLSRPRMSRIFYRGKLFDYPIKPMNALMGLGIIEAIRCVASYVWVRFRKPDESNYEGWVASRFGWRLYRHFFKSYTEKVWGMPATDMPADWAAQRIKNLSLWSAVWNALFPKKGQTEITTLIDRFQYPKFGPGMMWERVRDLVLEGGGEIVMEAPILAVHHRDGKAVAVTARVEGKNERITCGHVISSMPMAELLQIMQPPVPEHVLSAARHLRYRDFLTIALVVPESAGFPDNWIYVHSPDVRVGRIQNFGSWSPYMVKDGRTCLGLEYFVNEGDDLWSMADEDLVELAKRELQTLGIADTHVVDAGYVVRVPKAYPVYDEDYRDNVDILRSWLDANTPNVHPVGRNGMHKYNNQDHSMFTAMLTVESIADGVPHDVWQVNVEEEYHEEGSSSAYPAEGGTGRSAPVMPSRKKEEVA